MKLMTCALALTILSTPVQLLISTPAFADDDAIQREYDKYNYNTPYDNPPPQEQVRPLGGNYYNNGDGSGQGWTNYTGGHSCYTSTVNGYSLTTCN